MTASQTNYLLPIRDKKRGLYEDPERKIFKFYATGIRFSQMRAAILHQAAIPLPWATNLVSKPTSKTHLKIPCLIVGNDIIPNIQTYINHIKLHSGVDIVPSRLGSIPKILSATFEQLNKTWRIRETYIDKITYEEVRIKFAFGQSFKVKMATRITVEYELLQDDHELTSKLDEIFP